jgi:hypothetical protein
MAKTRKLRATLRVLPSLIAERPPEVQLVNRRVVKDSWTDPQDDKPTAARTARQVSGYRQFCPLRRCRARHGERSSFSIEHVEAADRLRQLYDGSRLGFSALKDLRPIQSVQYRPSMGPTTTAMRQLKARQQFTRVWSRFSEDHRAILIAVVLRNMSLTATAALFSISMPRLTQTAVELLDRLVEHFEVGRERRRAA